MYPIAKPSDHCLAAISTQQKYAENEKQNPLRERKRRLQSQSGRHADIWKQLHCTRNYVMFNTMPSIMHSQFSAILSI